MQPVLEKAAECSPNTTIMGVLDDVIAVGPPEEAWTNAVKLKSEVEKVGM